jgi:hypothetical protein
MVYVIFFALVVAGLGSLICAVMAAYYLVKIAAMSGEEVQVAYDNGARWPHQWIRYVGTPLYQEGRKKKISRMMARKRIARIGIDRYGKKIILMETLKAMEGRLEASGKPAEPIRVDLPPVGPPEHYYGVWRLDKGL